MCVCIYDGCVCAFVCMHAQVHCACVCFASVSDGYMSACVCMHA